MNRIIIHRHWVKRIVSILLFALLLYSLLWLVNRTLIMKRTDGIAPIQNLYAQDDNTIDVLLMGSSKCGMNLDTEILWEQYGISSYLLWGSVQPYWNTYYNLREALKTQHPKVVVLDTYAATLGFEYSDESRQVVNICGMNFSLNKLNAIRVSAPKERWLTLLLGLPSYHTRYNELIADDFQHYPWTETLKNQKGGFRVYGTNTPEMTDPTGITEVATIYPKQEEYLRKIISLCQEENIELMLISTPGNADERATIQPYFNAVQQIAEEYELPYYNFNIMDDETGFTADCYYVDNGHMNTKGTQLLSRYLGNLLKENYDLEDHRGDPSYDSWNKSSINLQNQYLTLITDEKDYYEQLDKSDRSVFLIKNTAGGITNPALLQWMNHLGIDLDALQSGGTGAWFIDSTVNKTQLENCGNSDVYQFEYDGIAFTADLTNKSVQAGGYSLPLDNYEVICIVYDANTHAQINAICYQEGNGFVFTKVA